jgi:hypothetical protein
MRCTKCSFISFDDLSACAKCAADLSNLSQELNGTCTETRPEFFLGSAVQTPGLDEDGYSDSQMLPPIDQSAMNFDDTSTGGFAALSSSSSENKEFNFDDSTSLSAEDDVAIELGDIMPIDFDQLDSGSVLTEGTAGQSEALNFDDLSFEADKTANVTAPGDKEIDLDFSDAFSDSGETTRFNGDLSQDIPVVLADDRTFSSDDTMTDVSGRFHENTGFNFSQEFSDLADSSGSFDETITLNSDGGMNKTQVSLHAIGDDSAAALDLDESLVAELAGPAAPDLSSELSLDLDYSDSSASGDFELDEALVAELASGDQAAMKSGKDELPLRESLDLETDEFKKSLDIEHDLTADEVLSFAQVEDLTGDFPPLLEEDDTELAGLDLADIDVSDLVDPSDKTAEANAELNPLSDISVEQPVRAASVDDTIREEAGNRVPGLFDNQNDVIEGIDALSGSGSDLDSLVGEIELPEDGTPQDFGSSSLDDTFRDGGRTADASSVSLGDDLEDDSEEELVLGQDGDDLELPAEIDALAMDDDFAAFLNKTASVENIPEIELITDDDDDLPPELPRLG